MRWRLSPSSECKQKKWVGWTGAECVEDYSFCDIYWTECDRAFRFGVSGGNNPPRIPGSTPRQGLKTIDRIKWNNNPLPTKSIMIGSFAKAKACHLPILDLRVGGREGSLNFPFLVQVFNLCTAASSPQTKSGRETIFCGGGAAVHRLNQGRNRLIKVKQA